jgi:hypothetical protein
MPAPMGRTAILLLLLASLFATSVASGDEWMYDPTFREGKPGDVLHEGPPPLLRAQIDAYVDLLESAFDLALPAAKERKLRDAVEQSYAGWDRVAREGFAGLVASAASLRSKARQGDDDGLQDGLRIFRRALDQQLAAAPDSPPDKIVAEVLELRRSTPWPGSPPVHGAAASAWLELVQFLVSLARNEDVQPSEGQHVQLLRDLSPVLHKESEETRRSLRDAHRLWLRTKAEWDRADVDKRLALRWVALKLLREIVPADRKGPDVKGGDLSAYALASKAQGAAEPAFDAWWNVAGNPALVIQTVGKWLGPLPKGQDETLLYR